MQEEFRLFYCDIDNFGDKLNMYIYMKIANMSIASSSLETADFIGIGSLLDMCLMDKNAQFIRRPLFIYSTGFGFEEGGFFHNKDIVLPEKLRRNVKCYALRGRLTLSRMQKLLKNDLKGGAIGDGGLLASDLVNKEKIKPIYNLGIVPHYADRKNPVFEEIKSKIPNSIILDVTKNSIEFLEDLAKCKAVISTAMHPLIAADSLGIPNMWVRISEDTTSRYKFYDYYSAFDLTKEPYNLLENNFDENMLEKLIKNYDIPEEKVTLIKENLRKALFKVKKDLRKKYARDKLLKFVSCLIPFKKLRRKIRKNFSWIALENPLFEIKENTQCLMVSPHADDETIGCGGLLLHYAKNFDVICIGSSGIAWQNISAEERSEIRIKEFNNVMDAYGIKNRWIFKTYGAPTELEIEQINKHFNDYLNVLDIKKYDYIFIPHPKDNHPAHKYITNILMKNIIKKKGYKKNLKIVYYEVWEAMQDVNWYEDIADVAQKKYEILRMYKSQHVYIKYDVRTEGLNRYRGVFKNNTDYAEAYKIRSVNKYLNEVRNNK